MVEVTKKTKQSKRMKPDSLLPQWFPTSVGSSDNKL